MTTEDELPFPRNPKDFGDAPPRRSAYGSTDNRTPAEKAQDTRLDNMTPDELMAHEMRPRLQESQARLRQARDAYAVGRGGLVDPERATQAGLDFDDDEVKMAWEAGTDEFHTERNVAFWYGAQSAAARVASFAHSIQSARPNLAKIARRVAP